LFLSCGAAILSFFGAKYAAYGAPLLVFLAVSTIPDAVTNIAVARWRVMERLRPAAVVNAVIALTALGLVAGPLDADRHGGVATIGMAWLIAQSVGCAVLAAMCVVGRCSGDRALVHSERAMAMEPGL
jgi:O-antigen/teichoic acid export membrane protein